jgi:hypothetical protein
VYIFANKGKKGCGFDMEIAFNSGKRQMNQQQYKQLCSITKSAGKHIPPFPRYYIV